MRIYRINRRDLLADTLDDCVQREESNRRVLLVGITISHLQRLNRRPTPGASINMKHELFILNTGTSSTAV
jgi:hypothetical protein